MSTIVDKKKRSRLSADQARSLIFSSARHAFSRAGYDSVGVREIAASADIDPAMVSRLFGSKEALFAQIAEEAFSLEAPFDGPLDQIGSRITDHLLQPIIKDNEPEFDEFQFLLRSIGSPSAAPILSRALHNGFIVPLSRKLSTDAAEERAALATAYVIGFAVLRVALYEPSLVRPKSSSVASLLAQALQACLE
ncbi:TetR family transcriptional regulator [Asaia sp. BMEF1]|uniref:TetR/AcrR family transcriptional regulator n=1 Tax=Asaia sp. BMEF1 TaxID=3155932 RepID=UPI003F681389